MTIHRILLASSSPRRKALLEEAGCEVTVVPPGTEEIRRPEESPEAYAARNAAEKAKAILQRGDIHLSARETLIAADTIVVLGEKILEKPRSSFDAVSMLSELSGKVHRVLTGVCITASHVAQRSFVEATRVHFRPLERAEIERYVITGEPMDKAGAYAIQGGASEMVERIEGSRTNVVGLPMERVLEELKQIAGR